MPQIALEVARRSIENWEESLRTAHQQAMECCDCEQFLKAGIDTSKWLKYCDEQFQEAGRLGVAIEEGVLEALLSCYQNWLRTCDIANAWIARLQAANYRPDNLDEFVRAEREINEVVSMHAAFDAYHDPFCADASAPSEAEDRLLSGEKTRKIELRPLRVRNG